MCLHSQASVYTMRQRRISPLFLPPTSTAGFFLSFEVLVPSHFKLSSSFYKLLYVQMDLLDSIHTNITRGELGFLLHANALSKVYKGMFEVKNQCISGCMRVRVFFQHNLGNSNKYVVE